MKLAGKDTKMPKQEIMRVNFDGARRNLATAFNDLVDAWEWTPASRLKALGNLQDVISIFLCMNDDEVPDDYNDLSGKIKLRPIDGLK